MGLGEVGTGLELIETKLFGVLNYSLFHWSNHIANIAFCVALLLPHEGTVSLEIPVPFLGCSASDIYV